jgi:DNA topoisomerase VI subunit B
MNTTATLQRTTFRTSRLLEYFSEKELTLQTGHGPDRWPLVVLKELIDNSLDACEEYNILPDLHVTMPRDGALTVLDNGPGLSTAVIESMLDFSVRGSSKDAYISPTRGAQGNALKTVVALDEAREAAGAVAEEASVPKGLVLQVRQLLEQDPTMAWDDAVTNIAKDAEKGNRAV